MHIRLRPTESNFPIWVAALFYAPFLVLTLLFSSCADETETTVEEIRFLLDDGRFEEAEVLARELHASHPDSAAVQAVLGRVLVAQAVVGPDTTYLGALAKIVERREEGDPELEPFSAAGRNLVEDRLDKLFEGRDLLADITGQGRNADVCVNLYGARLFEIAAILVVTKVSRPGSCLELDALGERREDKVLSSRFVEDLQLIDPDRVCADLPQSWPVNETTETLGVATEAAVDAAGGDEVAGTTALFVAQYPGRTPCP